MLIIALVRWHNRDIFLILFKIKVYCVFSLESPHRGDSNEYTQHTISLYKKENHTKSAMLGIFPGQRQRKNKFNSRGKRAISVWDTKVLL